MRTFRSYGLVAALVLASTGCASRSGTTTPALPADPPLARGASRAEIEASFLDVPRPYHLVTPGMVRITAPESQRRRMAWLEAGAAYERGQRMASRGDWDSARRSFNEAIDALLVSGIDLRADRQLRHVLDRMVDRIYEFELTAQRALEPEDEPTQVAAAIDEIVPLTFPPDSSLREEFERELASLESDLPIVLNDEVLNLLNYFHKTDRGRRIMRVGLQRKGKYSEMVERVFAEEGLPLDLINAAQAESAFRPDAVSRARAVGMWQFMSFRAREYGLKVDWWVDERRDPIKSTRAAARHMRDLYDRFGDWYLVLAAYNGGPGRVERAVERTGHADFWELVKRGNLPRETMNHVPVILAFTIISKDPERYGIEYDPEVPLRVEALRVPRPTSLKAIAKSVGLPYASLKELNPHVLHGVTPPDYPEFELYVPAGMATTVRAALPNIPEADRIEWGRHRVHRGDTLSGIAAQYGTSAYSIAQANSISLRSIIRPGQTLVIPGGSIRRSSAARSSAPPVVNSDGEAVYTVRRGDTLNLIARSNGTSAGEIARANGITVRSTIHPGQKLIIPGMEGAAAVEAAPSQTYRVRKGDTLTSIAASHGTTALDLAKANNLSTRSILRVGAELAIPNGVRTHRVRSGETLWELSKRYGVSVNDLRNSNSFLRGRDLQAGDNLVIPPPVASAAAREE